MTFGPTELLYSYALALSCLLALRYGSARLSGLPVSLVSIGLGAPLLEFRFKKGPVFRISLCPIFFFVRVLGDSPSEIRSKTDALLLRYREDRRSEKEKWIDLPNVFAPVSSKERAVLLAIKREKRHFQALTPRQRRAFYIAAPVAGLLIGMFGIFATGLYENFTSDSISERHLSAKETSQAYRSGFRDGDVIAEIGGYAVYTITGLIRAGHHLTQEFPFRQSFQVVVENNSLGARRLSLPRELFLAPRGQHAHGLFIGTDVATLAENLSDFGFEPYRYSIVENISRATARVIVMGKMLRNDFSSVPLRYAFYYLYSQWRFPELTMKDLNGQSIYVEPQVVDRASYSGQASPIVELDTTRENQNLFFLYASLVSQAICYLSVLAFLPIFPMTGANLFLSCFLTEGVTSAQGAVISKIILFQIFALFSFLTCYYCRLFLG